MRRIVIGIIPLATECSRRHPARPKGGHRPGHVSVYLSENLRAGHSRCCLGTHQQAHASAKLLAGLPDGKLFPSWKPVTFAASESGCVHAVVGSLSLSKAFEIAV